MSVVATKVEWFPEPLECLLPATTEFRKRAEFCNFPDGPVRTYKVAFTISVGTEKLAPALEAIPWTPSRSDEVRKLGSAGQKTWADFMLTRSKDLMGSSERRLVARNALRVISDRQLLQTGFGNLLVKKRLAPFCIAFCVLTVGALFVSSPGSETTTVIDQADSRSVSIQKHSAFTLLATTTLIAMGLFICAHYVSRGLLQLTLRSFEAWLMFLSQLAHEWSHLYNTILVSIAAGEMSEIWIGLTIVQKIATSLAFFQFCHVDSIIISRFWKVVLLGLCLAVTSHNYFHARLNSSEWLSHEVCWYHGCSSLKRIYQLSLAHIMLFMMKALLFNISGRDFAFIHAPYDECRDKEEADVRLAKFGAFDCISLETSENIDTTMAGTLSSAAESHLEDAFARNCPTLSADISQDKHHLPKSHDDREQVSTSECTRFSL